MTKEGTTKDIDKKELETPVETKEEKKDVTEASIEKPATEKDEQDQNDNNDNETSEDVAGIATFKKESDSKATLFIVIAVVVALALVLLWRGMQGNEYVNPVHGYSYNYSKEAQLVSSDYIPIELAEKGYESMSDLGLTDGDSFLIYTDEDTKDSVVYTILELSARENYTTFEEYKNSLFAELERTKNEENIEYETGDSIVGKKIQSVEYYFEAEIPVDELGNTRTGVFYDNLFEVGDKAFSISFGYPKDTTKTEEYMNLYRELVSSFRMDEDFVTSEEEVEGNDSPENGSDIVTEGGDMEIEVVSETEEITDETVEE